MSAPRNPEEGGRRRSRGQPPRVRVTVAVTTPYGDPFVHREIGLLISRLRDAGAVTITIGPRFAAADFQLKAANPRRALMAVAERLPRPTAGTGAMFIATPVDGSKDKVLMSTDGWPDPMPEVPEPEEAFYR